MRRLVTIPISHFCEKARWALERAGLEYREERHVQGIHRIASRRAGGSGTVPVLVADEGVFGESEEILRYADARLEESERLFPADGELRDEVVGSAAGSTPASARTDAASCTRTCCRASRRCCP